MDEVFEPPTYIEIIGLNGSFGKLTSACFYTSATLNLLSIQTGPEHRVWFLAPGFWLDDSGHIDASMYERVGAYRPATEPEGTICHRSSCARTCHHPKFFEIERMLSYQEQSSDTCV